MSDTRRRVAAQVDATPGIHFNALVRTLDLAPGQVQYHLGRLRSTDEVAEQRLYGQTHYYPPTYDEWERRALALLSRETAADVVAVLLDEGTARPSAVAERVGIARSTLEWHLGRLVEQDLVRKRRDARNRVHLELTCPEETARLLRRATPSLPGRLVDRFTRLVDNLLEE
ncbi:winged helix-turn-helix transcriptional regulator [Halomarina oriensis]|uniref:Winged helix-turn-helix transcriptional regulator n=1 Tax=Halomarina oriensis TaxID=671145 RepID=A0A6B0GQJ4_9EURY|nr:winged helix-turn-helix transcriptional regulator [Halomarina oriensis]MWG35859.1 winged helix-turn-helix transcriptional regulator [Halomarina oriensis]